MGFILGFRHVVKSDGSIFRQPMDEAYWKKHFDYVDRLEAYQKKHGVERTMENLKISRKIIRDLLASVDDRADDHQMWVDIWGVIHIGSAHIDSDPPVRFPPEKTTAFLLEIFHRGNGYCGPKAAADPKYVDRMHRWISRCWLSGETGRNDWEPQHSGHGPDPYRPPTD